MWIFCVVATQGCGSVLQRLLSTRPGQCTLRVSGVPLKRVEKFEYLGVIFTSDGRRDIELDTRIAAIGAVMRQLQRSCC
ncbi:Uncharacterised protein r2_g1417 [Pycnogonum litorale]